MLIKIVNEPSKDSLERTTIFFPKEMLLLSKYFKNSEEESLTPTQIPIWFTSKVDNNCFSIFWNLPSLSGIGSP